MVVHAGCDKQRFTDAWRSVHTVTARWTVAVVVRTPPVMDPIAENRDDFLPTPPAFDAPLEGSQLEYCHDVLYGKTVEWYGWLVKKMKICLFVSTESTSVTDSQTSHDGIGRACI